MSRTFQETKANLLRTAEFQAMVGMISGEPFMATDSPEYRVELDGGELPQTYDKLTEAKAAARAHFGR